MRAGEIVFRGSIADLKGLIKERIYRIVLERPKEGKKIIEIKSSKRLGEIIREFEEFGVKDIEVFYPSIDEIVAMLYKGD